MVELPDDVDAATVASGHTDRQLSLTLIGIRSGDPNISVQNALNVHPDDEEKLSSEVPGTSGGTSLPLKQLGPG